MRARAIALFALLLLLVLPLPAQNAYPTKGQVRAILKDAKSVLAQFEKVTDRIEFARWDAPHGLISQRKAELKLIRRGVIPAARRWMADMRASERASGRALFIVFTHLDSVRNHARMYSDMVHEYERNAELGAELSEISGKATDVIRKLLPILSGQFEAEQFELRACRASTR